ncbi:MAG: hypothetical protein ACE5II_02385 [Anaerolineae bacterium]
MSLAVKYSSVLFPFDHVQFLRALSKQGFTLPEPIGPVPLGRRLEVSGIVGRKGEVSVRLNADRQVLAVEAPDVETSLVEMDSLESLLKSEFDLDSPSLAHYYEFLAGLTVKAKKNPLESWGAHFAQVPMIREASELLGTDVSPFGVRLAPKGEVPNQANWFDIRIEPLVRSATDHHYVEVIYRRSSRDEVFAFVRKFEDILSAILAIVERG